MIAAEICEADGASDERAEDQQMEVEDAKILQVAAVTQPNQLTVATDAKARSTRLGIDH